MDNISDLLKKQGMLLLRTRIAQRENDAAARELEETRKQQRQRLLGKRLVKQTLRLTPGIKY